MRAPPPSRRLREGVRSGARAGLLFGGAMLAIGLVRWLIALASGRPLRVGGLREGAGLVLFCLLYVGSFALGGAVVSALWPHRHSRWRAYGLGYLGAGIVCVVLTLMVAVIRQDPDPVAFVIVAGVMTLIFGTVAGYQIHHWDD